MSFPDSHRVLTMLVRLVDVDAPGHVQQLLEAHLVVLLDGAKDGREDKVVILRRKAG